MNFYWENTSTNKIQDWSWNYEYLHWIQSPIEARKRGKSFIWHLIYEISLSFLWYVCPLLPPHIFSFKPRLTFFQGSLQNGKSSFVTIGSGRYFFIMDFNQYITHVLWKSMAWLSLLIYYSTYSHCLRSCFIKSTSLSI